MEAQLQILLNQLNCRRSSQLGGPSFEQRRKFAQCLRQAAKFIENEKENEKFTISFGEDEKRVNMSFILDSRGVLVEVEQQINSI